MTKSIWGFNNPSIKFRLFSIDPYPVSEKESTQIHNILGGGIFSEGNKRFSMKEGTICKTAFVVTVFPLSKENQGSLNFEPMEK
jgi:hypothetical protein